MAWVSAWKKLMYQTPRMARSTGTLASRGVLRKWLSIQWAPLSSCSKLSNPMCNAMDSPIADHRE
uniref:Uncharacterized protein n=1 Tax=Anguilla anguilla TaxID=7936 RepID=A0A0E9RV31_ANGAN